MLDTRKIKGFTLIELLVVIAVIFLIIAGIIAGIASSGYGNNNSTNRQVAMDNLVHFQKEMGMENYKGTCVNHDSDGDGYVSCTLRDPETKDIQNFECASALSFNAGCRSPKNVLLRNRNGFNHF